MPCPHRSTYLKCILGWKNDIGNWTFFTFIRSSLWGYNSCKRARIGEIKLQLCISNMKFHHFSMLLPTSLKCKLQIKTYALCNYIIIFSVIYIIKNVLCIDSEKKATWFVYGPLWEVGWFILPKVLWYIESPPHPIILTTKSSPSEK